MTDTFIDSKSFVNRSRFQTKMGKIYTRFQTKTAPNLTLLFGAAHTVFIRLTALGAY